MFCIIEANAEMPKTKKFINIPQTTENNFLFVSVLISFKIKLHPIETNEATKYID